MVSDILGLAFFALPAAVAAPSPPAPLLVLEAGGLALPGGKRVRFDMPAAGVIAAVSAARGKPVAQGIYPDCGQGIPIRHVTYRGDLELSFIAGRFVGWTLAATRADGTQTAKGIHVGSTYAELKRAYPDVAVDASGESVAFASEHGPSGFLDAKPPRATVIDLHAGQTCIVD